MSQRLVASIVWRNYTVNDHSCVLRKFRIFTICFLMENWHGMYKTCMQGLNWVGSCGSDVWDSGTSLVGSGSLFVGSCNLFSHQKCFCGSFCGTHKNPLWLGFCPIYHLESFQPVFEGIERGNEGHPAPQLSQFSHCWHIRIVNCWWHCHHFVQ